MIRKVNGGYVHGENYPLAGEPDWRDKALELEDVLLKARAALMNALELDDTYNTKLFPMSSAIHGILDEIDDVLDRG